MASEKKYKVFEKVSKTEKGKSVTRLKEVKTDGSEEGSKKAVESLMKSLVKSFEVLDVETKDRKLYNRTLSGKNYEIKLFKFKEK